MATVEVPARHKALVYDNPGSISTKIEEVETPKPGVGEVLVNLTHSGGMFLLSSTRPYQKLMYLSMPLGKSFLESLQRGPLDLHDGFSLRTGHGSDVQCVDLASCSYPARPSRWP